MSSLQFNLVPLHALVSAPDLQISGLITRESNLLTIEYTMSGNLKEIIIPEQAMNPGRKRGLWEETCFELFIGAINSTVYWEVNLSPGGHWNVYRFKNYRLGMEEEPAFSSLPFKVLKQEESLHLSLNVDLNKIAGSELNLNVGISTIVKSTNGRTAYYSLSHPKPEADFHNRAGFIIAL